MTIYSTTNSLVHRIERHKEMAKTSEILSTGLLLIIAAAFIGFMAFLLAELPQMFAIFAVAIVAVFVVGYGASKLLPQE